MRRGSRHSYVFAELMNASACKWSFLHKKVLLPIYAEPSLALDFHTSLKLESMKQSLPTQSPVISFFLSWALTPQAGMPLYTYTCLAWQHLMALGLTCSGTKKGRERKGRDKKRWICPNTVSQSTWTGPNPSNVMKPAVFFIFPHCPPASLPASVLCPSSFFFLSPAPHQEYQC